MQATLALALPLVAANLAQMAMGLTDTIMVGALGAVPLAAVGLGSGLYFTKVFEDSEAHRLIPSQTIRQRTGKLSRSEMLFIMVLFHLSPFSISRCSTIMGSASSIAPAFASFPITTVSSA